MSTCRGLGAIATGGLALGLAALPCAQVAAKERLVRHLGIDDKLLPEHVHAIAQDAAGFLWLGTAGGLVRYDGERLVPWSPAAIRGKIARLAIHGDVVIAAAWDGPVFRGSTTAPDAPATALHGPGGGALGAARDVFYDARGRIWLALRDGLLRSDDHGTTWTAPLATALPDRTRVVRIRPAYGDPARVLVVTTAEVYAVDAGDRVARVAAVPRADPPDACADAVAMPDGSLIVTQLSGTILRFRHGELEVVRHGRERGRAGPLARRGDVAWAALDHALYAIYPDRAPEELPIEHSIAHRGYAIFVDREDSLWVGNERGAFQFPEPDTVAWRVQDGLPPDGALRLVRTAEGLWVLAWGFHMGRIDPEPPPPDWWDRLALLAAPPRRGATARTIDELALHTACADAAGVLWGSTAALGAPSYLVARRPGAPFVSLGERLEDAQCTAAHDGRVWLAGEGRMFLTAREGGAVREVAGPPPGRGGRRLVEGRSGTLWYATDDRLCRASAAAVAASEPQRPAQSPSPSPSPWTCEAMSFQNLTAVTELPSGAVWLASNWMGLARRNRGDGARVEPIPGAAALPARAGHVLEDAADGGLWIGGPGYLMRVEERLDLPDGWAVLESLGPEHGVSGSNAIDILEDPDGTLWVTVSSGVLQIPRSARHRPPPILTPTVISAAFDGRRRAPLDEIHLDPDANTVELQLSALSYRDPAAIRFRVRTRADGAWSPPARQSALQLVDLPAGAYRVDVAASVAGAPAITTTATGVVAFVVDRPWYLRPWVWALGALAGAGVLFAIHRARVALALRLERQRVSIAMDLHDEVGSGLGGIGLMAGLTADGKLDDEARRAAAARIAHTARVLGESLAGIVGSLREERGTLRGLAGELAERAAAMFPHERPRLVVEYPAAWPDVPLARDVARNVRLIVAEALHNAAKHAQAARVVLGARADRGELAFWVEDDGRGTPADTRGGGLGLTSMRRRARRIGASLAVASPPAPGARGTRVSVTVTAAQRAA